MKVGLGVTWFGSVGYVLLALALGSGSSAQPRVVESTPIASVVGRYSAPERIAGGVYGTDLGWTFERTAFYKVYARWPALENRPNRIRYQVTHQGVVTKVFVDQTDQSGSWIELGRYRFDAGSSDKNRLVLDAASDTGFAVADAAWFVFDP